MINNDNDWLDELSPKAKKRRILEDELNDLSHDFSDIADVDFNSDIPISEKKTKEGKIKK